MADFVPKKENDLVGWLTNLKQQLTTHGVATLGLLAPKVTLLIAYCEALIAAHEATGEHERLVVVGKRRPRGGDAPEGDADCAKGHAVETIREDAEDRRGDQVDGEEREGESAELGIREREVFADGLEDGSYHVAVHVIEQVRGDEEREQTAASVHGVFPWRSRWSTVSHP